MTDAPSEKPKSAGAIEKKLRPDEGPVRLDRWMRRQYPDLTQGMIQKAARKGQIRVNGKKIEVSERLQDGDVVRYPAGLLAEAKRAQKQQSDKPFLPLALERQAKDMIIYEDDQLLVLNKPPGLATQGGNNITKHVDMMLDAYEGIEGERPKLVHRIDKETSGVLLVAKSAGIAAKLTQAFRTRGVKKEYWAVVVGCPDKRADIIDVPLVKVGKGLGSLMMVADKKDRDALSAKSEYEVTDTAGRKLSWLTLSPLSGRTHQLRVHCESLGTPILGDSKYGEEKSDYQGFPDRLHLHARSIEIPHPAGGTLKVSAPLPPHMQETYKHLGFQIPATRPPERKK